MGCIVNGPGEMADADYGYVGAGRGKISLYKKKECIEKEHSRRRGGGKADKNSLGQWRLYREIKEL